LLKDEQYIPPLPTHPRDFFQFSMASSAIYLPNLSSDYLNWPGISQDNGGYTVCFWFRPQEWLRLGSEDIPNKHHKKRRPMLLSMLTQWGTGVEVYLQRDPAAATSTAHAEFSIAVDVISMDETTKYPTLRTTTLQYPEFHPLLNDWYCLHLVHNFNHIEEKEEAPKEDADKNASSSSWFASFTSFGSGGSTAKQRSGQLASSVALYINGRFIGEPRAPAWPSEATTTTTTKSLYNRVCLGNRRLSLPTRDTEATAFYGWMGPFYLFDTLLSARQCRDFMEIGETYTGLHDNLNSIISAGGGGGGGSRKRIAHSIKSHLVLAASP